MLRAPRVLSALIATLIGTASIVATAAPSPAVAAAASADITVHLDDVIHEDFLGIGVNLIPVSLMPNNQSKGYTLAHWEVDKKRIQTLEPAVARVWFQPDWVETEKGVYDFDSEKMTAFYAYLDTLKEAGTEIELNYGWKVGREIQDWFSIPGVEARISAPADLGAFAAGASALLHELVNNRGYDNIDYLAFYNEPNGNWDFEAPGSQVGYYADMVQTVHERLTADGLRDEVEIWGPEEWGSTPWTQYMKDHVDDAIDAYSFHVYGGTYEDLSTQISSRKTIAGDKPVVLTEFGFSGNYDSSFEAGYGNYVIKMANEGLRGGLVWQLNGVWVEDPDETTDTNDTYTLWDSLLTTTVPNPRFAEAGLLSRYVPKHSDVLRVETSSTEVRAAAFRSPDGEIAVVVDTADGEDPRELTISYEGGTVDAPIHRFLYDDQVTLDANALLPAVSATFPAGTTFTDTLSERRTVAVYTTESPEAQVAITPTAGTVVSGQTLQLEAAVIDGGPGVTWSTAGIETPGTVTSSGLFTAPDVDESVMVAVRATSSADASSSGVALLNVNPAPSATRVDQPVLGLAPATYTGPQTIPVTTSTPGVTIHYTTDGTTPTAASPTVDGAVTLNTSTVLKVIAVKDGLTDSPVTSGLFRVKPNPGGPAGYQQCATEDQVCGFPGTASVAYGANGSYTYGVFDGRVRCSSAVFGGDPAPGSPKKCFFQPDTADRAAKPRITPAGGTFGSAQEVTITSSTADAEIRYTTDGSFPTATSTLYTAPITVDTTKWIKAVAIAPGLEPSPLAVVSFSIVDTSGGPEGYEFCATQFQTCSFPGSAVVAYGAKGGFVYQAFTAPVQCDGASFGGVDPAPNVAKRCYYQPINSNATQPVAFTPAPGAYSTAQIVTLSSATAGAVIHYTTDGTTATVDSPVYTGPVTVSETTTLSALAVADGKDPSPVVSGTYTIGSVNGGGPEGYTLCATEFQTCEFSGLATVAFGAEGSYFYQQFENSALCTTTTFGGDPAFNKAKKCWYRNVSADAVADPVFTPTAGAYSEPQAVTITTATAGATIRYTLDGSEPTAESPQYADPVIVAQTTTVKAIAVKDGLSSSSVVSAAYMIDASTVSTPTFSPGGGSFTAAQTVTITTATPDASIRYTLDGSTPTTESTLYTSPVGIATTKTVRAVAFKDGMTASPVATAEYTITTNPGGPEGYTFCANEWSVCDFDGTAHVAFGANGSYFYGTFTDGVGCYPSNFGGDPAFNTPKKCYYRLGDAPSTEAPTFSPAGGTYLSAQSVTLASPTGGAEIRYTTDGSAPDSTSILYTGPIAITETTTVRAMAIKAGLADSPITEATYTITPLPEGPEGYTYCSPEWSQCSFEGLAAVAFGANDSYFYGDFTDGALCVPDSFGGDPAFNTPKACFIRLGGLEASQTPTITPAGGSYAIPQTVTIDAPGTVHYTTDGSTPDLSSPTYSAPIQIPVGSTTIKAIAIEDGKKSSEVATADYVITAPTAVAAPTFSLPSGIYLGKRTVTITSSTPGAVIRYTTNGSTPTSTSSVYTKPIALSGLVVLRAAAFVDGSPRSGVTTAAYLVIKRF